MEINEFIGTTNQAIKCAIRGDFTEMLNVIYNIGIKRGYNEGVAKTEAKYKEIEKKRIIELEVKVDELQKQLDANSNDKV